MTKLIRTVGLILLPAAVVFGLPDSAEAYPTSGTYEALPGSMTSDGPFTATGVLVVNDGNGTATFEVDGIVYNGVFTDAATLHITGCSAVNNPPALSQNVNWTFAFGTNTSFAWTGLTRFYANPGCSGPIVKVVDYTDVDMELVGEPVPLPDSGTYETVPGSYTNEGPFIAIAVLDVDTNNSTATFDIGGNVYVGNFTSSTTLMFSECVSVTPSPPHFAQSELVNWTFEFDTPHSFAWTGTSTLYLQPFCTVQGPVVQYTNVRMVLSGPVGVKRTSWGQVKSFYR
jgi:hypothetical protein